MKKHRIITFALLFAAAPAFANAPSLAELREQTFQQMLSNPENAELALRYAQQSEALGDYEGAISPLERLLMFNPKLPAITLKIGTLYYRLRSYDMAKLYFSELVNDRSVPQEIASEAKQYLAKM